MTKTSLLFLLLGVTALPVCAQSKVRRLPSIINHPSLDVSSPYISHDGNALLFVSNSGQDGALTVMYTARETDWSTPVELPKHLSTRLNFFQGYALSADGRKLYFTCAKSPVVGGYDIFVSELKGTAWSTPENLSAPINSRSNDGCPSFTPDGNTLYFMRCDKMDQRKAGSCQIFRTVKKSNGQWEEPVALPESINTGNAQTPRIMADGETLIFSSDKAGGKGGMDLYMSRLRNGSWSAPVPLDFVNTAEDDQYISVAALGRYLLKEASGARNNREITEFLIPDNLRPKGIMKLEGKVSDASGAVVPAYISVSDMSTGKRIYSSRPANDGSYYIYLPEGTRYELSVDPEQSQVSYFSRQLDLTGDKVPQKEKINVVLKQPAIGDEIVLDAVQFKATSSTLQPSSDNALKQLARFIKANPGFKFEIQVLLSGYVEDAARSSADLTEVSIDSIHTKYDDIDSLGQLYKRDTIMVKKLFHNDRTPAQAQAIIDYLVAQGASQGSLTYFVNAIPATMPENKKLTVKAVVRKGS
ncbi:hypothetical protein [Dawidia soli]|uniref:PD40 domain-containing protein n=1 Tax=Dawidia soli TaxID=2782352 RepID=A0AAP2D9R0_9BACT|nr:hypothetical protein [Dawidia soli]MBT1685212.1 PD40 domain-containing protein [Dawidia soli]